MKARCFCFTLFVILLVPYAFAQWIPTNGPFGGQILSLAFGENRIFVGTPGGVFRSTDRGDTWMEINNGLTSLDTRALATLGTYVFAGTYGGGVYRSTIDGNAWTPVDVGLTAPGILNLLSSGTTLLAATDASVFRSVDSGATWMKVDVGYSGSRFRALAASGTTIFAGTANGSLFRSTDSGATWTLVSYGAGWGGSIIALAEIDTILFSGIDGDGIVVSTDGGSTWLGRSIPSAPVYAFAVKDNALFAGTSAGVFRTTDAGANWTAMNNGLNDRWPGAFWVRALAANDSLLLAGTEQGGVYRSTNGGETWTAIDNGLMGVGIKAFAVGPEPEGEAHIFAATTAGVHRSSKDFPVWTPLNAGLPHATVYGVATIDTDLFVGTGDGVYRSADRGESWSPANEGLWYYDPYTEKPISYVISLVASGEYLFAGTVFAGVFRSTDRGNTWASARLAGQINLLAATHGRIFAAADLVVYSSIDGGNSWTLVDGKRDKATRAVAIIGNRLFAGTDRGVFLSTDEGATWVTSNSGLTNTVVSSFATDGRILFAGTEDGVFLSADSGESWTAANAGLRYNSVSALAIYGDHLVAGTASNSVWRRPFSEMVISLAPELLFPPNNGIVVAFPRYDWRSVSGTLRYHIQVSQDSLLANGFLLEDSSTVDTTHGPILSPSLEGRFYWRVRARTIEGWSSWSERWQYIFSPEGVDDRNSSGDIPKVFSLEQNVPNPFNPATTVQYALPRRSHVTLTVYNTLGQQVATLVNGDIEAGNHQARFDASSLASGLYFYRLQAGSFVDTKKLLLIR